jgi:hypothetical protein
MVVIEQRKKHNSALRRNRDASQPLRLLDSDDPSCVSCFVIKAEDLDVSLRWLSDLRSHRIQKITADIPIPQPGKSEQICASEPRNLASSRDLSLAKTYLKLRPIVPRTGCLSKLFDPYIPITLRKNVNDIDILPFAKLRDNLQASERQIARQTAIVLIRSKSARLFLSYRVVINFRAAS